MLKKVGLIGLGNMGRGMALTLKRKGFELVGTDVSTATRESLLKRVSQYAKRSVKSFLSATWSFCRFQQPAIVEQVVSGPNGILANAKPGLLVVDTSTSHPETTRRLARALNAAGMSMLDAPVSGGPKGAITATMAMVIGGVKEDLERAEPILAAMTAKRVHVGDIGAGHVAKIANNLFAAAHLLIAGEVTRMAAKAGVPTEQLLQGINAGSGRSFITEHSYPTWIMNGQFDSGFTMKLMRKDVRLSQELISALAIDLPMSAKVAELWALSAQSISDDEDFNRIVELGTRDQA
jgi:3-hydroxyisobutyrate dehydrogenase